MTENVTLHSMLSERIKSDPLADIMELSREVLDELLAMENEDFIELVLPAVVTYANIAKRHFQQQAEKEEWAALIARQANGHPAPATHITRAVPALRGIDQRSGATQETRVDSPTPQEAGQRAVDFQTSNASPVVSGEGARGVPDSIPHTPPPIDILKLRYEFLSQPFTLQGVGLVTWGLATVEHHSLRIEQLGKKVVGLKSTIDRHQQAIDAIKRVPGATCLNDLRAIDG